MSDSCSDTFISAHDLEEGRGILCGRQFSSRWGVVEPVGHDRHRGLDTCIFVLAAEDPAALFEIISHAGMGTSDRPAALSEYLDGLTRLVADHGGIALGTYEVTGVLIGDGREWDEARVWWFADPSDLEALLADPELAEVTAARDLASSDSYRLVLDGVQVEPLGRTP